MHLISYKHNKWIKTTSREMLLINYNLKDFQCFTWFLQLCVSSGGKKISVFYVEIRSDFMELQHVPQTAYKQMMTVLARVYVDIRVFKHKVLCDSSSKLTLISCLFLGRCIPLCKQGQEELWLVKQVTWYLSMISGATLRGSIKLKQTKLVPTHCT